MYVCVCMHVCVCVYVCMCECIHIGGYSLCVHLQIYMNTCMYTTRAFMRALRVHYSVKRDLLQCQKRPTTVSKETYYSDKRDLLQCQKRPTTVSKETYYSVKRDLCVHYVYTYTLCMHTNTHMCTNGESTCFDSPNVYTLETHYTH